MKRVSVLLTLLILVSLLAACGPGDSPEKAAKEWTEALLNLDGNTLAKRTCAAQQENVQSGAIWLSALTAFGQMFTGQRVEADISDLHFEIISKSGKSARVRVYGEIRTAVLAIAQTTQVDTTYTMVQEGGKWKWCGEAAGAEVATPAPLTQPEEWNATVTALWLGQEARRLLIDRVISPYIPEEHTGWQLVAIDIAIENFSNSWKVIDPPSGELIDTGGYTRDISIYVGPLGRREDLVVPPGFSFLITAISELPTNQQPSTISIQVGSQQISLDLAKTLAGLKPLNEITTANIVQSTPFMLEIPSLWRLVVNHISLIPHLSEDGLLTYIPILDLQAENTGGYDLPGQSILGSMRIFAVNQWGYYTGMNTSFIYYDEEIGVFASTLPPGFKGNGIIKLQPFIGETDYAYIIVGIVPSEMQGISWHLLKVNKTTVEKIWRSVQLVQVSDVILQKDSEGSTDYLDFYVTLSSTARERHEVEVTIEWDRTTGSPPPPSCPENYRETEVSTEVETRVVSIGPGETLEIPFHFDYMGYCLSVTGVIRRAEITRIDGFPPP